MQKILTLIILVFGLNFTLVHTTKSYSSVVIEDIVYPIVAEVSAIPEVAAVAPEASTFIGPQLKISSIGVQASIKDMGLTTKGAMAVPNNTIEVGWYSPGTRPGNIGSAVIGAHNYWDNTTGVFSRLEELGVGDIVTVIDAENVAISFVVRETRLYNPTDDATDIFTSSAGSHLNLITCSGTWDPATDSYTKRFVVFTDLQSTDPTNSS